MRLASIDIGTNSVKLLVADVEEQQIKNILIDAHEITRLGQNVDKNGKILPDAMVRTLDVITKLKNKAKAIDAVDIFAFATSAMRDAENSIDFTKQIKEQTDIDLHILSGDEEAELTYIGVCSEPEFLSKSVILVDVGGGSTEFIIGQNGIIEDKFSINIGCVRLTEEFIHTDPIELAELQKIIQKIISTLYIKLSYIPVGMYDIIGVGGTITTLSAIHQHMEGYSSINVHGYIMQKEQIVRLLSHLHRMTLEERKKVLGLQPERADIIVAGTAIFSTILEILKSQEITISKRGLRYGALLKMANL